MRCPVCRTEMVNDVEVISRGGVDIYAGSCSVCSPKLLDGKELEIRALVCPRCGKVELYTPDIRTANMQ